LGPFQIFTKFSGDICNFVVIAGVVDTGNKLFTINGTSDISAGVVVTGDKLLPVSLTLAMRPCPVFSSFYDSGNN
jgi:hypothetical protein